MALAPSIQALMDGAGDRIRTGIVAAYETVAGTLPAHSAPKLSSDLICLIEVTRPVVRVGRYKGRGCRFYFTRWKISSFWRDPWCRAKVGGRDFSQPGAVRHPGREKSRPLTFACQTLTPRG